MQKYSLLIIVLCSFFSFLAQAEVSLSEAYQAALKNADHDLLNRSIKEQAQARVQQARSYLFPTVSAIGQYKDRRFKEDESSDRLQNSQKTIGLNLRQPLFQGGLFAGLQREKLNREISDLQVKKNDLSLYQQVAEAYYRISLLASTIEVFEEIEKVSANRLGVVRQRVRIGRSKQSDLLTNELQNQELKLELGRLRLDLETQRNLFARLTGLSADVNLATVAETLNPKPLQYYIDKISQTPELQIQNKNLFVAEKEESIARSQHLPKLYFDIDAKYGEVTNNHDGNEYTALLTVEIPLFEGGRTMAATREATWKKSEQKARLHSLNQDVLLQINTQYNQLSKSLDLFKIYEQSLVTARKNYQFFNKELELGLVSNLELLNSLSDYLSAKKNREEAFFQLKIAELSLSQLVGEIY